MSLFKIGCWDDDLLDTNFDRPKDRTNHSRKVNDHLWRRHLPPVIQGFGRGDEVTDGMNDDSRQGCIRNVEEKRGKGIDGEKDNKGRDDASQGCSHTRFRLDGRSGETTRCRISPKERAEDVGEANGNELLELNMRYTQSEMGIRHPPLGKARWYSC